MARISLKEQYDNENVIYQIHALRDMVEATDDYSKSLKDIIDQALAIAQAAAESASDSAAKVSDLTPKVASAQADATLALEQAEDAQTDADKGIVEVSIDTSKAAGTLYTKTNANVELRKNIPLASETQTGLMNAQTYQTLAQLGTRVSALEAKKSSAYVVFTSPTPTQSEITEKFTAVVGRAPIAGDVVTDISKGLTYEYDGSTWIQTTAPIAPWSNNAAGIIKGTDANGAPGTLFAEEDGTGSVNGWDELIVTIANLSKAFSGYSFTELADRIRIEFDAVDGVTTVSEEIPAATEEKAGVLSASDWARFNKAAIIKAHSVSLPVQSWVNGTITVDCPDVTADNIVWISPAGDSYLDYTAANVRCTAQGAGTLTFKCDDTPEVDITVNAGVAN